MGALQERGLARGTAAWLLPRLLLPASLGGLSPSFAPRFSQQPLKRVPEGKCLELPVPTFRQEVS